MLQMLIKILYDERVKKDDKNNIFKSCRVCSGNHPGVRMTLQKFDGNIFFTNKQNVAIRWYGYQSIRNDLLSISRPVLDRNEQKTMMRIGCAVGRP